MRIAVLCAMDYNDPIIRKKERKKKMGFVAAVIVFASLGYDMYCVIRNHGNN